MDILFMNLHRRYLNNESKYGGFLGIHLLSAFIRSNGYEAKSYSGTLEQGLKQIKKQSFDMLGLYCDFENVSENLFLCKYVKDKYNVPVIIGGPQATALKEKFYIESKVDAVVRYEGELTVLELMNYYLEEIGELKNIKGISYFEDEIKITVQRPLVKNLDSLPFIDKNCYLEPNDYFKSLSLMTGRGCPYQCAFCHEGSHTKTVRLRSVENVLAEIDSYLKHFTNENIFIFFTDDTFTLSVERLKGICAGLRQRRKNKNFEWFCEGHIHTLYKQPEMIDEMARSGCVRIQLGIESGNDEVLKLYGKHTTTEEIIEVVKRCRDAGIREVYGNIIIGANFNEEVFEKDKAFAMNLLEIGEGTVELGVVTYWSLSETPMTNEPSKYGLKIVDNEFVTSVGDYPQVETETMNRKVIAKMQLELEEAIYSKMRLMLKKRLIPTERILSWYPKENSLMRRYGSWFGILLKEETMFKYYEMLKLNEGFESKDVEISKAKPLRVIPLYKHMNEFEDLTEDEFEILTLTTGKISVEEISKRLKLSNEFVMRTLNQLEEKFVIVYQKH